jgi:TP53 regulating kinase-like protein
LIALTCTGRVLRVIYLGAEALVAEGEFLGYEAVFKLRLRKPYRVPELDREIIRRRTLTEARLLLALRELGVRVPAVLYVDPVEGLIVMEKVRGRTILSAASSLSRDELCSAMSKVGVELAKMHKGGVAHGDVTTANMVLTDSSDVYLVDLGLAKHAEDLEDLAVDVHLLIRVLESSHYAVKDEMFKCFLGGYREVLGEDLTRAILEKVREIRLRGRYVEERRLRSRTT